MDTINIAIVEDELFFVRQLQEYIRRYEKERGRRVCVTTFSDGEDITDNYRGDYDIILMDIQMRFMDGMTAAEKIREMDQEVIIMFITNMIQYAIRGYKVDAMDYVVKPVEYFAFSQKLDKAVYRLNRPMQSFISVPTEDGLQKLAIQDIYYIESQGHYAKYKTAKGEFLSRAALKDLEETMGRYGFFRCAKGFMVNMKRVDGISGNDCVINDERIPVSRNKKKEFMNRLLQYMNEE